MPWGIENGHWAEQRCSPLDPNPQPFGGDCTLSEHPEGVLVDNCGPRAMCLEYGDHTECRGFCQTEPCDEPGTVCCEEPETACAVTGSGTADVCPSPCFPLTPDCPEGYACFQWSSADFFTCRFLGQSLGDVGETCSLTTDCRPDLACAPYGIIPGCPTQRCCTPLCDMDGPPSCDGVLTCQTYFENGAAVSGYENLGWCLPP
jgi:hypothetical protein